MSLQIKCMIVCLLIFASCEKSQVDTEAPFLKVNTPFEGGVYRTDIPLPIDLQMADNYDLSTLEVRVHDNIRPHSEVANLGLFIWDTLIQTNIFGEQTNVRYELDLPSDLPGIADYHCLISCTDISGNKTEKVINFQIQNVVDTIAPDITLKSGSPISTTAGELFYISAEIEDNICLKGLSFDLLNNSGNTMFEKQFEPDEIEGVLFQVSEFITAPTEKGNYVFTIKATDVLNNEGIMEIPVAVL